MRVVHDTMATLAIKRRKTLECRNARELGRNAGTGEVDSHEAFESVERRASPRHRRGAQAGEDYPRRRFRPAVASAHDHGVDRRPGPRRLAVRRGDASITRCAIQGCRRVMDPVATTAGAVAPSDVSVVVATYRRPDVLRTCLKHIESQTTRPREVLVVDASPDRLSERVVDEFNGVRYVRNNEGMGTLPRSRQIGVAETSGTVIAFLDDDAFAEPRWLEELASTYRSHVGGVGGRARNDQPGEAAIGVHQIGQFLNDGTLTGNFAADPGKVLTVEHLIGCNMSFRREAILQSGGIPAWPAGVSALREDLLLSLRIRDAGWGLVFNPAAAVLHIGAPQARGKRFDLRYEFTASRNHIFVLVSHFGPASPILARYAVATARAHVQKFLHPTLGTVPRALLSLLGGVVGLWRGIQFRRR